jgi:hypothetical protein
LWCLFWALYQPSPWRALVAGITLGLALYAYPAAYFMPVAVGLVLAHYWLTQRVFRSVALRFGLFYGIGFVLCALPLGLFAWQHPAAFFMRPGGVAAHDPMQWLTNARLALGGLFWRGDLNVAYNVPGRPFLDGIQSGLFVIGLGVCLYRFREPAFAMGPLWLCVMLVPQVITDAPQFARMSGATPGILLIVAIGGLTLWRLLAQVTGSNHFAVLGIIVLTLVSAGFTAHAYFVEWPQSSDIWRTFRVAERREAELAMQLTKDSRVYLSPIDRHFSTVEAILGADTENLVGSFDGRVCTVLPPAGQAADYLLTAYEDTATQHRLAAVYGSALVNRGFRVQGQAYMRQIKVPATAKVTAPAQSQRVTVGRLGDLMEPMAVVLSPKPQAGAPMTVSLLWQIIGQTPTDYTLSLYLFGPTAPNTQAKVWSQVDAQPCMNSYATSVWRKGESVLADFTLNLPSDLPSGQYALAINMYDLHTMTRLPAYNAQGQPAGDSLELARLDVQAP